MDQAVRRYRHRIREINSSMKAWKDDLRDYKKAKFRAAELEQQLQEVKKQVSDLNAAVNFLLQQAPNNGHFFHEVCTMCTTITTDHMSVPCCVPHTR
jgi:predicted  nucleic acid-binding Zn-ribbon protein